jgi:hypothetical protein
LIDAVDKELWLAELSLWVAYARAVLAERRLNAAIAAVEAKEAGDAADNNEPRRAAV